MNMRISDIADGAPAVEVRLHSANLRIATAFGRVAPRMAGGDG